MYSFRLRNDAGKIRKLVESSAAVSYKDVTMLKLILSSGLYPQFGMADEYNNYKSGKLLLHFNYTSGFAASP